MKSLLAILAIAIGLAAIVRGGLDDAPGAQLFGVLLVVGVGSAWLFRRAARKPPPRTQCRGTSDDAIRQLANAASRSPDRHQLP